jgi:hypothetical protein
MSRGKTLYSGVFILWRAWIPVLKPSRVTPAIGSFAQPIGSTKLVSATYKTVAKW